MASLVAARNIARPQWLNATRTMATATQSSAASTSLTTAPAGASTSSTTEPNTYFKITMRRSAISLGDKKKGTVASLGIHRRHQTVYHKHGPEVAGKILLLKELLEVENVPESQVKTTQQQRTERRPPRGYQVVGSKKGASPAFESS